MFYRTEHLACLLLFWVIVVIVSFVIWLSGRQSGGSREAAFLRGVAGVRVQSAGSSREEDVWVCGAGKYRHAAHQIKLTYLPFDWIQNYLKVLWTFCLSVLMQGNERKDGIMFMFLLLFSVAAGISAGALHVLSPRVRTGQRLQPLQDGSHYQHPKCKWPSDRWWDFTLLQSNRKTIISTMQA